jgi:ubiquinone/menaquinone biosynthesis C-methylase UbiE
MMEDSNFDRQRSEYFDNLSASWDGLGPAPSAAVIRNFLSGLAIRPGATVMDLGTGTGLLIPYIFECQPEKVIAADLSAKMLAKVRAKHGAALGDQLALLHTDIHHCGLAGQSVDVVICNGAYPHFHNKPLALAEMNRILKPGGVLAINHFSGKEFINSVHAGSASETIRRDLLDEVGHVGTQVEAAGFLVKRAVDNESEYCLVAIKP